MNKITVIQIDDHLTRRADLRAVLESINHCDIVEDAINTFEADVITRLHRPDLILIDLSETELRAFDVVERLVDEHSLLLVVLITHHFEESYVSRAIQAGVRGYVVDSHDHYQELRLAIRVVLSGQIYISPIARSHKVTHPVQKIEGIEERLTARQCEVLKLIAQGQTTKGIARELHISPKTVESHRAQLMNRLQIHDVPGLVRCAIRAGLVSLFQ